MQLDNADSRTPAASVRAAASPEAQSDVPTILLVEDETFVREVAVEVLRSAGYRVLVAPNAAEGVLAFHSHPGGVQLLLTDVVLPDRNGCDLALELKTASRGVKAIFISGYPENSITRKGLQETGWRYLPKPFSASSLLQTIAEVLSGASR